MAGLFSVFNESEINVSLTESKESQSRTIVKLKSLGNVGLKAKGLSVRSNSDLNVFSSNIPGKSKFNLNDNAKPQLKQSIPNKQFTLPSKIKMTKSKSFTNIIGKKLSPKISSPIMQNVADNYVFRKPETPKPKKKVKECPEPEKLSYYYDPYKYMNEEIEDIFNEDRKMLRSIRKLYGSVTSLNDEGFISDPEIEPIEFQNEISFLKPCLNNVELPQISDYED